MSQNQQILAYLQNGNSLTPMSALTLFNCWALSSRISQLNDMSGIKVNSILEKGENGKHYSRYSLEKVAQKEFALFS